MPVTPYSATAHPDIALPNLTLESTLQDLPLHDFQIDANQPGQQATDIFDANPLLPGIILVEEGSLVGMISRRRFLEQMSRPYGLCLFLNRPLTVLYSFISSEVSVFPGKTLIVAATRQALRRPPEQLYEPVVVQLEPQVYRLLDVYQLLVAQSHIHEMTRQLLYEQTQAQMIQAEKMASLGRMVAGVAHEILNPVNFISGNIRYLSNYSQDLIRLLSTYQSEITNPPQTILDIQEEIELDFVIKDLTQIIDSMRIGAERLKGIASSLRNFSHTNENDLRPVDIRSCIDNTLLILNNRLKNSIVVVKRYGDIPTITCHFGQISQVFMNLISNAIDALTEKAQSQPLAEDFQNLDEPWEPTIIITTEQHVLEDEPATSGDPWVLIKIADNGPGIPEEIQGRIFETFFTTKPVGEGTGLGLAISHQIIVEKHGGKINLQSEEGQGTTFEIWLPLKPSKTI